MRQERRRPRSGRRRTGRRGAWGTGERTRDGLRRGRIRSVPTIGHGTATFNSPIGTRRLAVTRYVRAGPVWSPRNPPASALSRHEQPDLDAEEEDRRGGQPGVATMPRAAAVPRRTGAEDPPERQRHQRRDAVHEVERIAWAPAAGRQPTAHRRVDDEQGHRDDQEPVDSEPMILSAVRPPSVENGPDRRAEERGRAPDDDPSDEVMRV